MSNVFFKRKVKKVSKKKILVWVLHHIFECLELNFLQVEKNWSDVMLGSAAQGLKVVNMFTSPRLNVDGDA